MNNMTSKLQSGIYIASANEIDAIVAIEKKCFPGKVSYSKRQLEHLILNANSDCLVEKEDGVIRAFLIVTYRKGSLTCNIETVDVDPAFKNRGIGLKLVKAAEIDMKRRGMRWSQLEVSEGNEAALKLYKNAGYKFKERIESYYKFEHNGTRNAIRMVKEL
ncbi:N-acetyltransferase [Candidatus Bathyarchaeota archaeon]|nr:N-acetyltransferase [Candidatus Bathyarchaeota archaeon]